LSAPPDAAADVLLAHTPAAPPSSPLKRYLREGPEAAGASGGSPKAPRVGSSCSSQLQTAAAGGCAHGSSRAARSLFTDAPPASVCRSPSVPAPGRRLSAGVCAPEEAATATGDGKS
jgi:hypothetical protein